MKIKNVIALITVPPIDVTVDTDENFFGPHNEAVYGGPEGRVTFTELKMGDRVFLGFSEAGGFEGIICALEKDDPKNAFSNMSERYYIPSSEKCHQKFIVVGEWEGPVDPHICFGTTEFGSFFCNMATAVVYDSPELFGDEDQDLELPYVVFDKVKRLEMMSARRVKATF